VSDNRLRRGRINPDRICPERSQVQMFNQKMGINMPVLKHAFCSFRALWLLSSICCLMVMSTSASNADLPSSQPPSQLSFPKESERNEFSRCGGRGPSLSDHFQDLKSINFYVYLSPGELNRTKDYPLPLHSQNLAPLFLKEIEAKYFPFVVRDEKCSVPSVTIATRQTIHKLVKQPDALTVIVRVDIFKELDIVVLRKMEFRPQKDMSNYSHTVATSAVLALPLDASEDDLTSSLNEFAKKAIGTPMLAPTP
jgi:hypothetical protein